MTASIFDRNHDWATELRLSYTVDPNRDYAAEVDYELPAWSPEPYETSTAAGGCAFSNNTEQRSLFDSKRQHQWMLPQFLYRRAVSPTGQITALIVSTCRPSPENPDGSDGIGSEFRIRGDKQQRGWLVVEPGESFAGLEGDRFMAWAFAVRDHRRKIYEAGQVAMSEDFMSAAAAASREANRFAMAAIEQQGQIHEHAMKALTDVVRGLADNKTEKRNGK